MDVILVLFLLVRLRKRCSQIAYQIFVTSLCEAVFMWHCSKCSLCVALLPQRGVAAQVCNGLNASMFANQPHLCAFAQTCLLHLALLLRRGPISTIWYKIRILHIENRFEGVSFWSSQISRDIWKFRVFQLKKFHSPFASKVNYLVRAESESGS